MSHTSHKTPHTAFDFAFNICFFFSFSLEIWFVFSFDSASQSVVRRWCLTHIFRFIVFPFNSKCTFCHLYHIYYSTRTHTCTCVARTQSKCTTRNRRKKKEKEKNTEKIRRRKKWPRGFTSLQAMKLWFMHACPPCCFDESLRTKEPFRNNANSEETERCAMWTRVFLYIFRLENVSCEADKITLDLASGSFANARAHPFNWQTN